MSNNWYYTTRLVDINKRCSKCSEVITTQKWDSRVGLLLAKCWKCGASNQFQPDDKKVEPPDESRLSQDESRLSQLESDIKELKNAKRGWFR